MANVNINRNLSDQFYRYKMPKLVAKVEGKGNGIKTVIVNMPEIAKSLNRPPMYPTKYFGWKCGAQVNFDNKSGLYIVNGAHDLNKLRDLLDEFVKKYVLCQSCENPETILSVNKKKEIGITCMTCGFGGTIPTTNDLVAAYILENPPPKPASVATKKRVFDKDLGVELMVDDETNHDPSNRSRNEQADQSDSSGRKRAKFDSSLSSQVSSQPCARTALSDWKKETMLQDDDDSGSENFEDIDYGDDDDEFNSDNQHDRQPSNQAFKSMNSRENQYKNYDDDDGDDEHENRGRDQNQIDEDDEANQTNDDGADGNEQEGEEGEQSEKEHAERCKYWPNCNAGDECSYYHPTKPCRAFPSCRFGKKCLYIHPPCKFNPNCIRPACPFAHPMTTTRAQGPGHFNNIHQPLAPRCKYGFKCMNLMCKFSHQRSEPCRFGSNCLLETCAYTHPSDVVRKKPTSAFRWSAQS